MMFERKCAYCGEPMYDAWNFQKYHTKCAYEVNKIQQAKYRALRKANKPTENKTKLCEHCGKLIVDCKGNQRFHHECRNIIGREQTRIRMRARKSTYRKPQQNDCVELSKPLKPEEMLVEAIFKQAAKDWRALKKGKEPTGDMNFKELEYFFKHESGLYLTGKLTGATILAQLKSEGG